MRDLGGIVSAQADDPVAREDVTVVNALQHAEETALRMQAVFLRRRLVLLTGRRDDALAYIQALEANLPAARRWDATGHYPAVEVR